MRPVIRGNTPRDSYGNAVQYAHYGDARDSLIERVGNYCSYCEVALHSSIQIEHVQPKSHRRDLETSWDNFLFACDYCNPIKGDKQVELSNYYWPDQDNTTRAITYDWNEPPKCAAGLNEGQMKLAKSTIDLTGLDRVPGHPKFSTRDRRWEKRNEAWGIALLARKDLQENDTQQLRNSIVREAISIGFWSVWMAVFFDDLDMRRRFVSWFPGTAVDCFDGNTQPIARPGGRI